MKNIENIIFTVFFYNNNGNDVIIFYQIVIISNYKTIVSNYKSNIVTYYFPSLTKSEVIKYEDISGVKQQRL